MGTGIAPPPDARGGYAGDGETDQSSLDDYAEDVSPTDRQGETINERRERLQDALEEELEVVESHQFGSFTRGTMVGPLTEDSDSDVMFVLDEDEHGQWVRDKNGSKNSLRAVKRALNQKYPNSQVSIDRNVVAVQFHDFTVEVAPAFRDGTGGYHIPDTYSEGQSWVRTNPRGYKQRFEAVDQARSGRLQKVARVAKKYRDNENLPVSSYHMEVMAYDHVHNHPDKNASTDELVDGFFEQLPERLSRGTRDPVNNDRLDESLDRDDRRRAIKKARKAREDVREAREYREQGNTEKADEKYSDAVGEEVNDE